MIKYKLTKFRANQLKLGFKGEHCDFTWKPYDERSPEARAAYDALRADMIRVGMLRPLITYQGHVLIGMRRFEIEVSITGERVWLDCYEVMEDVSQWGRDDIDRLEEFKKQVYGNTPSFIG